MLSGSPRMCGHCMMIKKWSIIIKINPKVSLIVKYKWNGILYLFLFAPNALLHSFKCKKKNKCITTNTKIINGRMKWNE